MLVFLGSKCLEIKGGSLWNRFLALQYAGNTTAMALQYQMGIGKYGIVKPTELQGSRNVDCPLLGQIHLKSSPRSTTISGQKKGTN